MNLSIAKDIALVKMELKERMYQWFLEDVQYLGWQNTLHLSQNQIKNTVKIHLYINNSLWIDKKPIFNLFPAKN
jgi:hypothetical protein